MSWIDEPAARHLGAELPRLRAGEEEVFRELVVALTPVLLRLARGCTSTDAAAQDAVQDTWLVVVDKLSGFEGRSSLKTWICGICLHTARRQGVRDARVLPFSSAWAGTGPAVPADRFAGPSDALPNDTWLVPPTPWHALPEERFAVTELQAVVEEAIARLPPRQRAVMTARDVVGLDAREVARALALTPAAQRVLLHRARSSVRAAVERYAEDRRESAPMPGPRPPGQQVRT